MPKFLSKNCKDLIRQMLNTDARQRITAKQIMEHDWIKKEREGNINNTDKFNVSSETTYKILEKMRAHKE